MSKQTPTKQERRVLTLAMCDKNSKAALGLLTQDEADKIIGEPGEEHGVLIRGVEAIITMMFSLLLAAGLRKTTKTLDIVAKAQVTLLALIHYSYALGIKHERERGEK